MRAKRLEIILGSELHLDEADMVQRFQKLRDVRLLPISRGRNAEDITRDAIVSGLLSVVVQRPGFAGITTMALRNLQPVGGGDNGFAKAQTFALALRALLENEDLLNTIKEIRITDSEVYTNSHGRGAIIYNDGEEERVTYYVQSTAVSLLQPGREADYNPRELISSMIREIVIFPYVLKRIVRELKADEEHARVMGLPIAFNDPVAFDGEKVIPCPQQP